MRKVNVMQRQRIQKAVSPSKASIEPKEPSHKRAPIATLEALIFGLPHQLFGKKAFIAPEGVFIVKVFQPLLVCIHQPTQPSWLENTQLDGKLAVVAFSYCLFPMMSSS